VIWWLNRFDFSLPLSKFLILESQPFAFDLMFQLSLYRDAGSDFACFFRADNE
jgi:hypothetical protein